MTPLDQESRADRSETYELVVCLEDAKEVQIACMLLALRGRRSLVLVDERRGPPPQALARVADRVVSCPDICAVDHVMAALAPYRDQICGVTPVADRLWPSIFAAFDQLVGRFPGIEASLNARIKPRMRRLTHKVAPVPCCLVHRRQVGAETMPDLVSDIGLPVIIKPLWGHGSNHLEIVTDPEQMLPALTRVFASLDADRSLCPFDDGDTVWDPQDTVLIEKLLPGMEYSLEAVVSKAVFKPLLIQEKHFTRMHDGFRYETCNLIPSPFLGPEGEAAIHRLGRDMTLALGLHNTVVHIEMAWDGEVARPIEVNPRMGGGGIPRMLEMWFDTTVRDWPMRLYLDEGLPELVARRDGFFVGVFFNSLKGGVFRGMTGLEQLRRLPGFSFDIEYCQPGQVIPEWEEVRGARQECLYIYDAFFLLFDPADIEGVISSARETVTIALADTPGTSANAGSLEAVRREA